MGNKQRALELGQSDWRVLLALGMNEEAVRAMPFYNESGKEIFSPYLTFKSLLATKEFGPIKNNPDFLKIFERSRIKYEENKKKFSVGDLIKQFPSSIL